ncbi:MAG TPA: type II secretion system protein GspH [candidate division Zixibacteria bacterium]|nr:type II secretion system protein GspH [candidate division Zixibacteria bacterium]
MGSRMRTASEYNYFIDGIVYAKLPIKPRIWEGEQIMFSKLYNSRSGFTLIELMTTVVIIGIVAAMVAPTFDSAIKRNKFKGETKQIVSMLRTARSNAIAEKTPMGLYYDNEENKMILFKEMSSPSNFRMDWGTDTVKMEMQLDSSSADGGAYVTATFSNEALVFQPNGSASESGTIDYSYFSGDVYCFSTISVLASTGRAKVEYMHTEN